jgi:hypothetical protein
MFTAAEMYGGAPSPQPTPTGVADHPPGSPAPHTRTVPRPPAGLLADPVLFLVALLAVAVLLVNFSVRFEVSG